MKRRIPTVLAGLAAIVALIAVPSALAAYTSTKLEVQQVGSKLTAKISANPDDDPTAAAQVYATFPSSSWLTSMQSASSPHE